MTVPSTAPPLIDAMQSLGLVQWLGFRELLKNLVVRDLRLKYRGSVLGFLWSMVNPLLTIGIYAVAFGYIIRVATESFVLYLVAGLLAWGYFAASASASTGAVIDSASLVKAIYFPRAILPVATVLFNLTQFLLTSAIALPAALLIYRIPPSWPMVAWLGFVALQTLLCIGLALLLSTWTALFRDVRHFLDIALQILFWLTPIVYESHMVPPALKPLAFLSPMTPFVIGYHQCVYYRHWPDPMVWAIASAYTVSALVAGLVVFRRYEDRFTELL
jgi:ABC-2 type transport system permease protein